MFSKKIIFKIGVLCMLLFCFSINTQSQSSGIKGTITDQANVPLEMVSVALLNSKDNSFLSYTTTDKNGAFLLNDIPKDTVVLQLNLLGFKTFSKN
jgi:hypothetical protein